MEWQKSQKAVQIASTQLITCNTKWNVRQQYSQVLYDKSSKDKREIWASSMTKVCMDWDQARMGQAAMLRSMAKETELYEATKKEFAKQELRKLASDVRRMNRGWQALHGFENYILECTRFAYTTKQEMLTMQIQHAKHTEDTARQRSDKSHWTEVSAQNINKRPQQWEGEHPQSKRRRYPTEPSNSMCQEPTNSECIQEPMDNTDEPSSDAIWLCGEGQ
jgi:hypothetical protein